MKQIAILSGKGGTGKTTLTGALAVLMENGLFSDCDVDAPDLHLLFQPEKVREEKFSGMKIASIDHEACIECGKCVEACNFGAISEGPVLNPLKCDGCSVCYVVCPADAVQMSERDSGRLYVSKTRVGTMVHARLNIAEEASGKLVSRVREVSKETAEEEGRDIVLIDGPPGVGCPVIATLGGVDMALVITEPTVSGLHDLHRVVDTARFFKVPVGVVINKHDLNTENTRMIEEYCEKEGLWIFGKLPYDDDVTKAMVEGKTVLEYGESAVAREMRSVWKSIKSRLEDIEEDGEG